MIKFKKKKLFKQMEPTWMHVCFVVFGMQAVQKVFARIENKIFVVSMNVDEFLVHWYCE